MIVLWINLIFLYQGYEKIYANRDEDVCTLLFCSVDCCT